MAKMNKAEAMEAAKGMARRHERVKSVTLEELSTLDYIGRQKLAEFCREMSAVESIDTHARYMPDARIAFTDEAKNIWARLEREQRNKRNAWASALRGITIREAQVKLVDLLKSMNIRGMQFSEGYFSSFAVRRARAEATLYVRFDRDFISDDAVVNPDNKEQRAGTYKLIVDISWGGTSRTLADAEVSLKLYRELLDAAQEIVATFENERVIWTYGVEEEKKPVEKAEPESTVEVTPGC